MPYQLDNKLVIGLASSALFQLDEADSIFKTQGEAAYRKYQREKQNEVLNPGVAFPFIRRILSLNELDADNPLVEVILLSRNDPDTGLRVMNSIKHHGLEITRAAFLQGRSPHVYIPALQISLFLSANESDVREAIEAGHPAGQVLDTKATDDAEDRELRIAFDFDGVLADDESEAIFQQTHDLGKFHENEQSHVDEPHNPGPLTEFLRKISAIQKVELLRSKEIPDYKPKIRISIVTARNAPSHERVINTMRSWDVMVNEAFFLGGIEKRKILEVLRPHMFFDDQRLHLDPSAEILPSVHIPFGVKNI